MADIKTTPSPCESCTTAKDPTDCERKSCTRWQAWIVAKWDYWAPLIRQKLQEREVENGQKT